MTTTHCIHCNSRPVMDKPDKSEAKVCQPCFLFGMARLMDESKVIPEELDDLTVGQIAKIFRKGWKAFALKCYTAVVCGLSGFG